MRDRALIVCSFLIGFLISFLGWPPNKTSGELQDQTEVPHVLVGPEICREVVPEETAESRAAAVVRILESAVVEGDDIRLEHVACIWGEPELVERLRHVYLGSAPLLGNERVLTAAVIPLRFRQAGIATDGVELQSTENGIFTVKRLAEVVAGEQIAAAVRDALLAAAPPGTEATVIVEETEIVHVPVGADVEIEVNQLPALWHGTSTISVNIWVDGTRYKTIRVRAHVELYTWALVASQSIARGETLGVHNTELQKIPLQSHLRPVTSIDERGLRATRAIREGAIIEERFVEPVPDALKGHRVLIMAQTAGVTVSALGELLRDGYVGDLLPVRNLASGAQVYGRLIGPDQVQVEVLF